MPVHVGIPETEEGDNYKIHLHDLAKGLQDTHGLCMTAQA